MNTPRLETKRLLLRAITLGDAHAMQHHFANWNVIKTIGSVPWPYPLDGAESYIRRRLEDGKKREIYFWGIIQKQAPRELIGAIEYRFFVDEEENRGFWLSEAYWGRGLMTEAVAVTQDFIFFELKKAQILVRSLCTNGASKAVKEKTGASLIGKSRGSYHEGEMDEDVWEITPASWALVRGNFDYLTCRSSDLI